MKHSAKHLFRSCLSMLLVLCMVCSLPLTALAADSTPKPGVSGVSDVNGDGIITYVSFGDSVTNGYGMEGYRFDDGTNVFGFRREPAASYPALIRNYLTEKGFKVDLEQMAISGFRMDELHWMLCDDYVADSYHDDFFATWNRTVVNRLMSKDADFKAQHSSAYDGSVASANKIIMTEYRNAVKNADLITIDLGTNNFGTFVTNTIQEILGLKKLDYKVDFSQYVDEKTAASLDAMLGQMVAGMLGASEGKSYDLAMTLARCLMYGYLGFTEHFDGAIEAIYEINPKAKVVVIDCYTMITGVELAGGALGENIDLDALYDMFIDLANFYSRELSPYANVVTHATLDSAPELFIDYYKDYPDASYPDSQYMHPSAERLMNEFVMENMGYDPDDPDRRGEFNEKILAPIQLLDSYVNNLSATIKTDVIDEKITPQLNEVVGSLEKQIDTTITAIELIYTAVEGVATAKAMLPTAIDGVKAARTAVDASAEGVETAKAAVNTAIDGVKAAEAAVDTAIDGVATAESLVDMVVEQFLGHSLIKMFFKGSKTSDGLYDTIIDNTIDVLKDNVNLSDYGLENTDENYKMVAEEVYAVAVIYYDEINYNGGNEASATKLAVIEVMSFFLLKTGEGYTEESAEETAVLAYELNAIYEAEGKAAAVKAAIETEITDELMATLGTDSKTEAAEMVYYLGTAETETAVKAAIETQMTEETLAELGLSGMTTEQAAALVYELGTLAGTYYKAAVIKAMTLKVDQATAELAYAMVEAYEANGEDAAVLVAVAASLTDENMAALAAFGITDRTKAAEMVCQVALLYNATYADTNSDKEAVVTCLVELAKTLGIEGIDKDTASTGYDLYTGVYAPAIEAGKTEAEAKALTVVAAIKTQYPQPEGLAEAIYAVYKGIATKDQEYLAYYNLMVGVANIPADVAKAICTCYTNNLDGQYNNESVKTTMIFFMTQALGMSAEEATENYNSYLTYKRLPTTLSKIAKVDTIYFDALLSATAGGNLDLKSVAAEFMAGTLVLEKPTVSEEEDPEAWAEYKSDSALATLFFRFMSQDGIYTHPSEAGQQTLYQAVERVLNSLLTAEPDREIAVTSDSNVLVLGDFIAANAGSYVDNLAGKVTNLSNSDFRLNEIRALLDSTYARDEYAQSVLASVSGDDYVKAVQDSDVIILNVGSMNMGLIAKQLGTYMVDGSTYSMEFSDIGNMQTQNLGVTMDAFLKNFSGTFSTDAVGALMLSFETYGYGFTTFADCLDNTIETIQSLNPQADIVLVGMYDLMGDAYIHDAKSGMYLEMGHFIGHAVNLMNLHMSNYAAMTDNVTYVDVTATETKVPGAVNMMENGVEGIAAAFGNAVPTAEGYAYMAQILNCTIGAHIPAGEIAWTWADDYSAASASFHCDLCGEQVTCKAAVTCENTATCTDAGKLTYTATVQVGKNSYKDEVSLDSAALGHDYNSVVTAPTCTEPGFTTYTCGNCRDSYTDDEVSATGHSWGDPAWTWTETEKGFAASACFTCGNNCGSTETVPATMKVTIQESTCTDAGLTTYTATVEFAGKTYTDVKTENNGELAQHSFGEWTETKAPTCTEAGEEARGCTACVHTETREIAPLGHRYGEDGKCHCGEVDPNAHPVCEYTVAETLTSGNTYILSLGGTQVGSYTFTQVEGGWTIQATDGSYLAIEDKTLVNSASAFTWTYANGSFSAVIETKSSNNWWSGIFGGWWGSGSSKEPYYLVASGSGVGISTSASGSEAAFYTAHTDLAHSFGSGVVTAPTCTEDGYTTYTCDRCGYSYTGNLVSASGHSYTASVTAPTCTKDGYTTYTCNVCGDSYTSDPTDATGHTMVDGVCTSCGHTEGSTEPPVVPEEGECTYLSKQSLTSGETYILSLGGTQVGSYTFTQVEGGWTIQATDGSYLAIEDKTLVNSASAFTWTYANGRFSAKSKSTSSNNWWGGILGGWWCSSNKTYYLVSSGNAVTVSTSTSNASATFYQQVTGTHVYGDPVAENGSHVFTCINCGNETSVVCNDAACELCHPTVPEASIRVSVKVTSTSSGSSWWDRFFGSSKKTYTAAITVEAEGTEVKSVAYSTDGGSRWTEGTSFTSSSNITAFDIRVEATNGQTYYFTYSNGTVTETA